MLFENWPDNSIAEILFDFFLVIKCSNKLRSTTPAGDTVLNI